MLANIHLAINGNSDRYCMCRNSWHKFPCTALARVTKPYSSANPQSQDTNAPKRTHDGSPKTNTRSPMNTYNREKLKLTSDEKSARKKHGLFIYSGPPEKKIQPPFPQPGPLTVHRLDVPHLILRHQRLYRPPSIPGRLKTYFH